MSKASITLPDFELFTSTGQYYEPKSHSKDPVAEKDSGGFVTDEDLAEIAVALKFVIEKLKINRSLLMRTLDLSSYQVHQFFAPGQEVPMDKVIALVKIFGCQTIKGFFRLASNKDLPQRVRASALSHGIVLNHSNHQWHQ